MAALDLARSMVSEVGIDSQLGSASGNPFAPAGAQPRPPGLFAQVGDWVLRHVVKPSVWVKTAGGTARWAPYGAPQTNLVPVLGAATLLAGVAAAAGAVTLGVWLGKRSARASAPKKTKKNPRRRRR